MERRAFWSRSLLAAFLFIAGILFFKSFFSHRKDWRVPPPKPVGPIGIVFHHSASPRKVGNARINARRIDAMHKKRGYWLYYEGKTYHIGYHFVILPDGTIELGRPEMARGAHAHAVVRNGKRIEYNTRYLGICLVGNFSNKRTRSTGPSVSPTPEQVEATIHITKKLIDRYGIPLENIIRHRDINQTRCPGTRFPYGFIMGRLKAYVASKKGPSSVYTRSLSSRLLTR
ncbi:MAG: N-acetylmuramoyl-L-alanine amidase [Armatimonadetes bacterium]|nr:N-acetylmuramoyl-L-alanine amidase [Armatimonadota bacterium]